MDSSTIQEKYGISKKMGIGVFVQTLLICVALVLTIIGIVAKYDSFQRVIVYSGQAVVCFGFILLGFVYFKKRERNMLRFLLYLYAFLEIFRAAFLNTTGIGIFVSGISRLLLAAIGIGCVLIAERADKKESRIIALCILILEVVLYLVFIFGYPGMMYGRLNRFLPLVSIFIAGSINLFLQAKFEQLGVTEEKPEGKTFRRASAICVAIAVAISITSLAAVSYDHAKRLKQEAERKAQAAETAVSTESASTEQTAP